MSDLRAFKVAVGEAARGLSGVPDGFTYADLKSRLGEPHAADEKRLRRWVFNRVRDRKLVALRRGRYAVRDLGGGVGVRLVADIHEAFVQAGGVTTITDLVDELGRDDPTYVRRILEASPERYRSGLPFQGHRRDWYVVGAERLAIPLPGRLIALDIQMVAGGRPMLDLPQRLRRRREQIAAGIVEAREIAGLTVEDLLHMPPVANALEWLLRAAGRGAALDADRFAALAEAWDDLEEGGTSLLWTTVRFWNALGDAFGVSPALLSRGCVARIL